MGGVSSRPTAPVISVNSPADAAGPQVEAVGATAPVGAASARGEFFFSSPRSHPIVTIARHSTARLEMNGTIIFPHPQRNETTFTDRRVRRNEVLIPAASCQQTSRGFI